MVGKREHQILLLLLGAIWLVGCGAPSGYVVPVDSHTQSANAIPKTYTVRTGDSLYMIAMEYDLDYLDLARWNGISSPYTIHRGQVLQLHAPVRKRSVSKQTTAPGGGLCKGRYYTVRRGDTLSEIADRCGIAHQSLAQWNQLKPPYTIRIKQRLRLYPAQHKRVVERKPIRKKAVTRKKNSRTGTGPVRLKRPVSGKVIHQFSKSKGVTGVQFAGRAGDPVHAAENGKVVYSGTGLVRYGKLLIIKHENNLLTAYAHNSTLLVTEGDSVKAGEQIAKMGSSGTDRVKLHFEVRKGGKPVNPMRYLR